jgi:hypothetical protein
MAPGLLWWHICKMPKPRTSYRIVPLKNTTYRIEAVGGDAAPVIVTHCMTEAEAQAWIRQRLKDDARVAIDRLMDAAKAIR